MRSYRYRTATLLGPWRETAAAAAEDAIRAKQARRDEGDGGWHWVVPGTIEEGESPSLAFPPRDEFVFSASGRRRG